MRYLRILNNEIRYPYDLESLKVEYPNTSFPSNMNIINLIDYDIFLVNTVNQPSTNDYTKNYVEVIPQLYNGEYYQHWEIVDATLEEINQRIEEQWETIRIQKNSLLVESDWTQLSDSPLSTEKKVEWVGYRQQLRNVTLQPNPFDIIWPTKPQ
jgi:hypothetical protein